MTEVAQLPISVDVADPLRIDVADGRKVLASRQLLAERTSFFAHTSPQKRSSTDDPGSPGEVADEELAELSKVLAPGARKALPALVQALGAQMAAGTPGDEVWGPFFEKWGVLHAFAAAHLLGASEPLDASRRWVAEKGGRLEAALSKLDVDVDAGSLRMVLDFGLDQKSAKSLIHSAAAVDAGAAVRVLLEKRGDVLLDPETLVDLPDSCGETPLHACAANDSVEVAAILIEAGADLEALCSLDDEEPVCEDNAEGDEAAVGKVVRKWTPLHLAASRDSGGVVELLLGARANVAACVSGVQGAHTPLHEAAAASATKAARILAPTAAAAVVDLASLFVADGNKLSVQLPTLEETPQAVDENGDSVKWARFLDPLNAKCGPNNSTPLHVAAENDSAGVVTALLDANADPCTEDEQGDTALHCAVLYGAPNALSVLLERGASVMAANFHGEIALHHLAEYGIDEETPWPVGISDAVIKRHFGRSDRMRELLLAALKDQGHLIAALDYKAAASSGGTPLHAAVRHGHPGALHAVRLLAESRANLEAIDAEGRTPMAVAMRYHGRGSRVVAALKELGAAECAEEDKLTLPASTLLSAQPATLAGSSSAEDPLAKALGGCIRSIQVQGVTALEVPAPNVAAASEGQAASSSSEAAQETKRKDNDKDIKMEDVKLEAKLECKEELEIDELFEADNAVKLECKDEMEIKEEWNVD